MVLKITHLDLTVWCCFPRMKVLAKLQLIRVTVYVYPHILYYPHIYPISDIPRTQSKSKGELTVHQQMHNLPTCGMSALQTLPVEKMVYKLVQTYFLFSTKSLSSKR